MHIPCRLYANYLSRVLDAEVVNMDLESTDSVEKIVTDTLAQLLQLGVYIHKLGRVCVCVVDSWWRGSVVERRSPDGELSLSCARPAADG